MYSKHFTNAEKMRHIVNSYSDGVVVTDYCKEMRVSRSSIYRWRKIAGAKCFSSGIKGSQLSFSLPTIAQSIKRSHVKTSRRKPHCRPL